MATKLFLRNTTTNGITTTGDGVVYDMITTAGAAVDTDTVTLTDGGTQIQWTQSAGGSTIAWISGRVPAGGFTLTTTDISVWLLESNMNDEAEGRYRVFKFTPPSTVTELGGGPFDDGAELGTAITEMTWTGNVTDTAFAENDRILLRLYATNFTTMTAGTANVQFNAANTTTGDSFFNIAETVTFKAEDSPISGTSTVTFTPTGTMAGTGALAGTSTLTLTPTGTMTGAGAIAGTSTLTFTLTGTGQLLGEITGSSTLTFTTTGTMVGDGALAGTSTAAFTPTGTMVGAGALEGTSTATFTPAGTLLGDGALAGTVTISFTDTGTTVGDGVLAGTISVAFTPTGTLTGSAPDALAGTSILTFTLTGTLTAEGAGSTVVFFTGVSKAAGVTHFQGISRPTIQLEDAGGGTYTVTKTHELSGELNPDSLSRETYLIDGILP